MHRQLCAVLLGLAIVSSIASVAPAKAQIDDPHPFVQGRSVLTLRVFAREGIVEATLGQEIMHVSVAEVNSPYNQSACRMMAGRYCGKHGR